jgi:predicted Zn-dependent protease
MLEILRSVLGATPGVSAYRIVTRRVRSVEQFLVVRELDMLRSKSVEHVRLTVYHDFEEEGQSYRGSMSLQVHPGQGEAELRALVERGVAGAARVRNLHYPLVTPGGEPVGLPESRFAGRPLEEWLSPLREALFAEDHDSQVRINSAELFLERLQTRILNSAGVDVSYEGCRAYGELYVEASGVQGEVELFKELHFADYDPAWLGKQVRRQLRLCRDRARAVPTPPLKKHTVLISGEAVAGFLGYYLTHSAAESLYTGISQLQVGQCVQGEGAQGDLLTLRLLPSLPNSPLSAPYDADGFPLQPVTVIEEGVLKRHWGPVRFCHYLGVPPTGELPNVWVGPGRAAAEELRGGAGGGSYLEVVTFSDFESDPVTGDFGGEIRLAYYSDGADGSPVPVTGGSVSGNIHEQQKSMRLSAETYEHAGFSGPATVRLENVSVAGVG